MLYFRTFKFLSKVDTLVALDKVTVPPGKTLLLSYSMKVAAARPHVSILKAWTFLDGSQVAHFSESRTPIFLELPEVVFTQNK